MREESEEETRRERKVFPAKGQMKNECMRV